jgi:hypothetical protein
MVWPYKTWTTGAPPLDRWCLPEADPALPSPIANAREVGAGKYPEWYDSIAISAAMLR